jgi:hypothetical protein
MIRHPRGKHAVHRPPKTERYWTWHKALVAVGAVVVCVGVTTAAWGYFSSTGTGTGSALVAMLATPTITADPPGTTVSLAWTPITPPSGPAPGYYVLRNGAAAASACGDNAAPITATSCTDTVPISSTPTTYSFSVVTVWRSWTSTSIPVQVLMPGLPTITWATPSAITAGTALSAAQLDATASVPGSFAYSPPIGTVLAVGSGQTLAVTFTPTNTTDYTTATGSVLITVTGPSGATGLSGTTGPSGTTGNLDDQSISFTSSAPTDATVGGATYPLTATATSGLPVSFAIDPSSSAVCSLSSNVVSFVGAGTCTIDAFQLGDASWNAAAEAQQSFTVAGPTGTSGPTGSGGNTE